MPLANEFLDSPDAPPQETFPLSVTRCNSCSLWQLDRVIPADRLYRHYIYLSSISSTVGHHARRLAAELIPRYGLDKQSLVVEIASNDGTVLQAFRDQGISVLGIEPARNIAQLARAKGIETCDEFFALPLARELRSQGRQARLILARHVCAHVDGITEFLRGVNELLAPEGVFVAEFPYLGDLIENLEFDTIYHEHLSYFSLASFGEACARAGLEIFDVEPIRLHGGSVLIHAVKQGSRRAKSERFGKLREEENFNGLNQSQTLSQFVCRLQEWRKEIVAYMADLMSRGVRLAGYGAAAKANTLLNYVPEVAASLSCIYDLNPWKQGKWTPGTRLPVKPPDDLQKFRPSHILILAWNFQNEIRNQLADFERAGGKFIVPFPHPRILASPGATKSPTGKASPVLVIGGTGLVGAALCRQLSGAGIATVALSRRISKPGPGAISGDLNHRGVLQEAAQKVRPSWIVHAAGFPGGVNACESQPEAAERFFLEGTRDAVEAAKITGAGLVLLSTDAVFSSSPDPVSEEECPNPRSKYGQLKLAAEELVRASEVHHLIIRTSNVYGWDPESTTPNFLMQVLQALEAKKNFLVSNLLRATPTWVGDLAAALAALMALRQKGTFHVVGEDYVTREEWARAFAGLLGLPQSRIQGSKDPKLVGARPILRLDSGKVRAAIGWRSLTMNQGHEILKKEWQDCRTPSLQKKAVL